MSGIFGYINLAGNASREGFAAMAGRMANWGPDGVGSVFSDGAAFGHALLMVTHESRFEKMPHHNEKEGILFTAAARLDNRDELCETFGIPAPERPAAADGQLVLSAYRMWGTQCCRHLFGDWSFAAWHAGEQRLFLARDHLGNTGLFYYFRPPLIVFASDPGAILAHPEVPCEIDELRLARNLGLDIPDVGPSRTYWKDVSLIPAAHTATLTAKGGKADSYWRLEEAPQVSLSSQEDCLEGFLDRFRRAVRVRLNSVRPVGSQLSAGLDSGAVTALAARELQKENRPLAAFTSVPLHPAEKIFPGNLTDEWPLARQVSELYENIKHIPVRADEITQLAAIELSLEINRIPQHGAPNMGWIISIFEQARRRNLGVMLTGQLGNGGVSWSGGRDYIFYLFAENKWRRGLQALADSKKYQGWSWFQAIKRHLMVPALLPLWPLYRRFFHLAKQTWLPYSFPREDFIRRLGLDESAKVKFQPRRIDPRTERTLTLVRNGTMAGPFWQSFGAFYGMEVRDPTADVRLLEFCMGLPGELDTFGGGARMLIRRSMAGVLPDPVRWNTVRGAQAADTVFRLMDGREEVEREISRIQSAQEVTRYIDTAGMRRAWDTVVQSPAENPLLPHSILRALNTAYFLLAITGAKENNASGQRPLDQG